MIRSCIREASSIEESRKRRFIFSCTLVGLILLEISFMSIPGYSIEGGRASGLAAIKYSLHVSAFVMFMIGWFKASGFRKNVSAIETRYFAYLLLCVTSLLISFFQEGVLDEISWYRLSSMFFLIPLVALFIKLKPRATVTLLLVSKFIPIAIIFILFFFSPESVTREVYALGEVVEDRLGGDVIPPNALGGMLGIAIVLIFYTPLLQNKYKVWLLLLMFTMLLMTTSRSSLVSLFVSVYVARLILNRNTKMVLLSIVLTVVIALLLAILPFGTFLTERQLSGIGSFGGRTDLWEQMLEKFADGDLLNLLFGFGYMLPNSSFHTGNLVTNSLHNGYFQVLYGVGILGFIAYLNLYIHLIFAKVNKEISFCYLSLVIFLFVYNFSELASLVLINSFSLVFIGLMAITVSGRLRHG